MRSHCKKCNCELNEETAAQAYSKSGKYRATCRKCRSKESMVYVSNNREKRQAYMRSYIRKIGRVKQFPCEVCTALCYKKYTKAFCSDKCRFMSYVKITDACWIWTGAKTRQGYGKFSFKGYNTDPAHRVSYKLFKGPIEENMVICHQCDIKNCVKPAHLWIGTHQENMLDMVAKDRQASKLSATDVYKIRELVEKFGVAQQKIVEQFKITSGTVSSIIHRRIWKHI